MTEVDQKSFSSHSRSSLIKRKSSSKPTPATCAQGVSTQVQIIDFDGNFARNFEQTLDKVGLASCGFRFNVVTVLGCQSSGKSTLLNSLFGTTFPEMNALEGRSQTTKGIWAAKDVHSPTLVIDVEGTDSKERGEDRLTFEHRASLFSLAVADAVIVNMWYHDLGRYSASNYGLLKTVLAVNLELFQKEADTEKTTMIFVIRDHSPTITPLNILEKMLHSDLKDIWDDIKKPTKFADSKASEFFKFVVVGIPSKLAEPKAYDSAVSSLRKRWLNEEAPTEYSRRVPADGFAYYAQQIWLTILNSAELDIPSQKEMVASYRCEEIKQSVLAVVLPSIIHAAANPLALFQDKIAEQAIVEAVQLYHQDAWRYQEDIYHRKKDQMLDCIMLEVQKPLERYLHQTRQALVKTAAKELDALCKKDDFDDSKMASGVDCLTFWGQLSDILSSWREKQLEEFDSLCGDCSVEVVVSMDAQPEPMEEKITRRFETELIRVTLEENLGELMAKQTSSQQELFKQYLASRVDELRKEIEALYLKETISHDTLWRQVSMLCAERATAFDEEFGPVVQGMLGGDDQLSTRDKLALITAVSLRELQQSRLDWVPTLIHDRFKKFFEADENGVPCYWPGMSQDKISAAYSRAKKIADQLIPLLSHLDFDFKILFDQPDMIDESHKRLLRKPIMSEAKRTDLESNAATRMLKSCQEAQFIQATGGKVATPAWWWWGIMVLLGWNEAMAILRSPFFLFTAITFGCILMAAYYTQNLSLISHSIRSMTSLALGVIIPVLSSLNQPAAPPAPTTSARSPRMTPSDTH